LCGIKVYAPTNQFIILIKTSAGDHAIECKKYCHSSQGIQNLLYTFHELCMKLSSNPYMNTKANPEGQVRQIWAMVTNEFIIRVKLKEVVQGW